MCIIAYKPAGVDFPPKKTLKTCFENNPDGAGLMFADGGAVTIKKGFMTFAAFWKALRGVREKHGDAPAYVMHFRISTQGGVNPPCTHPFPLSREMDDLRRLETRAKIGVAHNGIITLTSAGWNKKIEYSDTMLFITRFLSLIIKSPEYYKDADTLKLIERLAESRLAILDGAGHCETIGAGWIEEAGVFYSNSTYKPRAPLPASPYAWDDWDDWGGYSYNGKKYKPAPAPRVDWEAYYDPLRGVYDFGLADCPVYDGDESYCEACAEYGACYGAARNAGDGDGDGDGEK